MTLCLVEGYKDRRIKKGKGVKESKDGGRARGRKRESSRVFILSPDAPEQPTFGVIQVRVVTLGI